MAALERWLEANGHSLSRLKTSASRPKLAHSAFKPVDRTGAIQPLRTRTAKNRKGASRQPPKTSFEMLTSKIWRSIYF